ncbi:MAG: hypothetical protein D6679_06515 [Candidatus Hydrogenedentota bacterium]|nr:MAG: hypothetical protein D6679_06515 [Candidatus Hydrogenedentota bacterium]
MELRNLSVDALPHRLEERPDFVDIAAPLEGLLSIAFVIQIGRYDDYVSDDPVVTLELEAGGVGRRSGHSRLSPVVPEDLAEPLGKPLVFFRTGLISEGEDISQRRSLSRNLGCDPILVGSHGRRGLIDGCRRGACRGGLIFRDRRRCSSR